MKSETEDSPWQLRVVVPLDVELIVHSDALGEVMSVRTAYGDAEVRLPRLGNFVKDVRRNVIDPPAGFEAYTPRLAATDSWASWSTYRPGPLPLSGQVLVSALAFEMTLDGANIQISPDELATAYAKGAELVVTELKQWVRRFCMWGQLVINQPLDITDPAPAVVNPPGNQTVSWLAHGPARSWIDSSPGTIRLTSSPGAPIGERVADRSALRVLADLANDPDEQPPAAVSFLGEARLAALRGRLRLAINAVGTGLEALLTEATGLTTSSNLYLGSLVNRPEVGAAGIVLPTDIQATLIDHRNNAVHRGTQPAQDIVHAAIELLDSLVRQRYPWYTCREGLEWGQRPQRVDLLIMAPPRRRTRPSPRASRRRNGPRPQAPQPIPSSATPESRAVVSLIPRSRHNRCRSWQIATSP